VFARLESGVLGATIRGINIRDLKRALIPVPSKEEQTRMATLVDGEAARVDALDLLRELRTAQISAAVTGKINVRGGTP
jgi:type I restriction enzyme S subunit